MSNTGGIKANNPTAWEKVKDSTPAQFVKSNPVISAGGAVGTGIIVKQLVDKSELATLVIKKGAIPALGGGIAVAGVALIADAVENRKNDSGLKTTGKSTGGGAMILTGTEIVGQSLGINALKPITEAGKFISKKGDALGMMGISIAGAAIAVEGAKNMHKNGITIGNSLAVASGAALATKMAGATTFFGLEIYKGKMPITDGFDKATEVVGGLGLGLVSFSMGKKTKEALSEGKTGTALFTGVGSAAAGIAGVHVLGNASGIKQLSGLAGKMIENPLLTGAVVATSLTIGSYYLYTHKSPESGK